MLNHGRKGFGAGWIHKSMPEGTEFEAERGASVEIPPGHDAQVVGDDPFGCADWQDPLNYVGN